MILFGTVLRWGNVAEWVSAIVALLVFAAAAYLLFFGRRTIIDISANSHTVSNGVLLDVSITLTPVGVFRVKPYWPVECAGCPVDIQPKEMFYESWTAASRCGAEQYATSFSSSDFRPFSKFRRKRKGEGGVVRTEKSRRLKSANSVSKRPMLVVAGP